MTILYVYTIVQPRLYGSRIPLVRSPVKPMETDTPPVRLTIVVRSNKRQSF